ncbi:flagellar hook-associated protein FlgK [Salipaludibacillus sp. CF4.18]|uniref:flagellar hook-associated protein FlgK n=1 Tax=Salipaludibacillus sp. CF4.18 TaxID=3373081 RepID=UPI003EE62388
MLSTFHGLETARRALSTHQSALHTTGHNIANANTPGYSRQRVNFTQTEAFPNPAFNKPGIPGQLGTGVKAGEIQRVREEFLDQQFRGENNKHGYWETRQKSLEKVEDVMNELTGNGISNVMDEFWKSMQDLAGSPEDAGARSVVRQSGIAVADTFNYTYESLEAIQRDYGKQIGVEQNQMNSTLNQINELNKQIASVEPHGYLPNDLYDKRDVLVDELSQFVNISVDRVPSGGQSKAMADGKYTISLLDRNGQDTGITLVDSETAEYNPIEVQFADGEGESGLVTGITFTNDNTTIPFSDFNSPGSLMAMVQGFGYEDANGEQAGIYPEMMRDLDQMVATFVEAFNQQHQEGISLSEIEGNSAGGVNFFAYSDEYNGDVQGAAKYLRVSDEILASRNNIAAAQNVGENGARVGFAGDGGNALNLADVKDASLNFGGDLTNVNSFFQGVIGEMAVSTKEAGRLTDNSASLRDSVHANRQSVSSVSLDEEMTNMIQFQHAYNAAARNITMVDEMLDRIINGMGVGGR